MPYHNLILKRLRTYNWSLSSWIWLRGRTVPLPGRPTTMVATFFRWLRRAHGVCSCDDCRRWRTLPRREDSCRIREPTYRVGTTDDSEPRSHWGEHPPTLHTTSRRYCPMTEVIEINDCKMLYTCITNPNAWQWLVEIAWPVVDPPFQPLSNQFISVK